MLDDEAMMTHVKRLVRNPNIKRSEMEQQLVLLYMEAVQEMGG